MEPVLGNPDARVRFDLPSGLIDLGVKDLEQMKLTMILYLEDPDQQFRDRYAEFRESLLEEFRVLSCWISEDGVAHAGRWVLEQRGEDLVLARYPARASVMYVFLATLQQEDGGWYVESFGHEKLFPR